ncbi:short subunit dehydrogenase-like uncharacterized protein [Tamaricihabitans halophyticus]|uniref:Short subunit dehydrogenase-like uncharacterized protein n=1 Tax=Tamaricihabitans halophyticus TaxID=1262583 RepID=A0A4V2SV56_9PSEU|nr:saccharopine dehydrogenase NADP-binding domain-containing protein [Tamaricihabitans halophyticus]TCP57056.1 short subunit dehydrogenase-like uncharacterized protein [Tamaricihabitans halophyticus]
MRDGRDYDIVLFGATGFTGALTAEYLAGALPEGCRLALAGRNQGKLADLRGRLAAINPACGELGLLEADVTRPDSLAELARSARVVISTVGPYVRFGEPLVAACAEAGTDYLDLTGEPEFPDRMYLRYHERARQTGARLIHAAGFESIPPDLGAYFTVQQLPADVPLRVTGSLRMNGRFSGGTLASALTAFARGKQTLSAARARGRLEPKPAGRKVGSTELWVCRDRELGAWLLPMPTIDPQVVRRSARALDAYGPDFRYGHFLAVRRLPVAAGLGVGAAGAVLLAQLPPVRSWLSNRLAPGEGPSAEQRAQSWFKLRFVGEGGGRRVVTQVSGGDPGYSETAKMLAEAALCLAVDELPETAGQVTPAVALGQPLIDRLQRAGLTFEILDERAA